MQTDCWIWIEGHEDFRLFGGLLDGYYVASPLIQTTECFQHLHVFDLAWLHLLLHSKSTRQSTQRTFFFFFISSRLQLLFKDETLEFFDKRNISRAALLEAAFVLRSLVNISHQRAERLVLIESKHMLLRGLEEWIAHQLFCNLRAIFT